MTFINKISNILSENGVIKTSKSIIRKIARKAFDTNSAIWHSKSLHDIDQPVATAIPLSVAHTNFAEAYTWLKSLEINWLLNDHETESAKTGNHYWTTIKHQEKIIGCIKIGYGRVYINDYKKCITIPEHVAFIYDTFILSEFRSKKAASFGIIENCRFLKNQGFKRVMCHVPPWNTASLKAYGRAGFVPQRTIRWISIGGIGILSFNPIRLCSAEN